MSIAVKKLGNIRNFDVEYRETDAFYEVETYHEAWNGFEWMKLTSKTEFFKEEDAKKYAKKRMDAFEDIHAKFVPAKLQFA
jgi:hypothetical protein